MADNPAAIEWQAETELHSAATFRVWRAQV